MGAQTVDDTDVIRGLCPRFDGGGTLQRPLMILDQHFRTVEELFSPDTFAELSTLCRIVGGEDAPMASDRLSEHLTEAAFLVAARPKVTREALDTAPNLKAIIEVSGAFHDEIDYSACFEKGIEVLSCAPGFRYAVAEMGLAMLLAASRGLIAEHEAFRTAKERWLDDRPETDFSLFGQKIGFVGYGNIAREMHGLLAPFAPEVSAYDPWIRTFPDTVTPLGLEDLFSTCRAVIITAVPDGGNKGMVTADLINGMQNGAALILLSRAHVIDFEAAASAAERGKITFATDVYPTEPISGADRVREIGQMIHSPHRAAAVSGGRHPIGAFVLHDVAAILEGRGERRLLPADATKVEGLVRAQRDIERRGQLSKT